MCKITSSDIGPLVENLCFETAQYVSIGSRSPQVCDMLQKAVGCHVEHMVISGFFRQAIAAIESLASSLRKSKVDDLAISMISNFHIPYRWSACVFFDLNLNTKFTNNIFANSARVHISEVFGEKASLLVLDTYIPEQASVAFGNLHYPDLLCRLLLQMSNHAAVIECLKFYLRCYIEIPGDA